jgi:hypothetical protein
MRIFRSSWVRQTSLLRPIVLPIPRTLAYTAFFSGVCSFRTCCAKALLNDCSTSFANAKLHFEQRFTPNTVFKYGGNFDLAMKLPCLRRRDSCKASYFLYVRSFR